MDKFIVMGGKRLEGSVNIQAAKNSVLPLLSCSILCKEEIVLENCPPISDVKKMMQIIVQMGGKAEFVGCDIHIDCKNISTLTVEPELTKSIRSSVFMLGSLIARFKRAELSYPGGCEIGKRPIDIHIDGLRGLGVMVEETDALIKCDGRGLKSGKIKLSFPSVGATENMIMACALSEGETVIEGAAREPEVEDLARFLNAMGGKVSGAGTDTVVITGVKTLHGCKFCPVSDRIAAGTYLVMCACCGGDVTLNNCDFRGVNAITNALGSCGCSLEFKDGSLRIVSSSRPKALPFLSTGPFPDFPTDMQPQFCAMLSTAEGQSVIEENVFENRFKYAAQLALMGADIAVQGRRVVIKGRNSLKSGIVTAQDLRGGAALITAALNVDGLTTVLGAEHIDRGYYKIEETLSALNADIVRVSV